MFAFIYTKYTMNGQTKDFLGAQFFKLRYNKYKIPLTVYMEVTFWQQSKLSAEPFTQLPFSSQDSI